MFQLTVVILHEGKQGQKLKARTNKTGTDAQRGAAYWLAPHGLLGLLPYTSQGYQPRSHTIHNRPGPPTSTIDRDNIAQACLQVSLNRGIFSVEVSLDK